MSLDRQRPPRVAYAVAGEAHRATVARANAAHPPLRPREHRVLQAVLAHTVSWSRLTDRVSTAAIAETAGLMTKDGPDSKLAGKELGSLRRRGLIVYVPGSGRPRRDGRNLSLVGVLPAEKGAEADPPSERETWDESDPPSPSETWVETTPKPGSIRADNRGRSERETGVDTEPPPEKSREGTEKAPSDGGGTSDEAMQLEDDDLLDERPLGSEEEREIEVAVLFSVAIDILRENTTFTVSPEWKPYVSERQKCRLVERAIGDGLDAGLSGEEVLDALFEQRLPRYVEFPVGFLLMRSAAIERASERKRQWVTRDDGRDEFGWRVLGAE